MIVVSRPNGTNFVGPLTTLQVPLKNVTEVKVKNIATIVRRTRKKEKDDESKLLSRNPTKFK
jgi:hypothetical protein